MATIRDVAATAQVSTSTVSHVINGTRYVSPATRQRVLQAMEALSYSPNRVARSLRNHQTHSFGVLVPNIANHFFGEIVQSIETVCFDRDYNIIVGNAADDPERELTYLRVLLSRQVDGVILISAGANDDSMRLLASRQVPVIAVDRMWFAGTVDTVAVDNYAGGVLATEYLLRLGHRRIACVTGPDRFHTTAERVEGYRDAMAAAGIAVPDCWIMTGSYQYENGRDAALALLAQTPPVTAIFACNDLMAIGALSALHDAGLRVPQDVSVIGYDGIPLTAFIIPKLTTIAQPARELGRVAVERLIARLQDPHAPVTRDRLPVRLIERDSCAPAP